MPARRHPPLPPEVVARARELRKASPKAEWLLWAILRGRRFGGLKFRRQVPCCGYVLDFYCHDLALVVELDGDQHSEPERVAKDDARTRVLAARGLTVVRVASRDLMAETEAVLLYLWEVCRQAGGTADHPKS